MGGAMILGALIGGPVGAAIGAGFGNKLIGLGASRAALKYKCDVCGHEFSFSQGAS